MSDSAPPPASTTPGHDRTPSTPRPATPSAAWAELRAGNARFVDGRSAHPNQGAARRAETASGQRPFAIVFGCSDSRVAAEIVFDQGLGDLFVIRTAGHVADLSVLGSLEFGVGVLGCPLVVVLGHDSCGAVKAATEAVRTGEMPDGFVRDVVERVTPSVLATTVDGREPTPEAVERAHVEATGRLLLDRSAVVAERVLDGSLAVVGAQYSLAEGRTRVVAAIGEAGAEPEPTG
ncbi:MAG: carbonic anhydrase [Phycicoccus sp.]